MTMRIERLENVYAAESIWYYIGYAVGKFVREIISKN
jgi:hypothetical protein